mgnify:CR=1 FL=1
MQSFVFNMSELELSMNAVERISAYQEIAPEAPYSEEEFVLDELAAAELASNNGSHSVNTSKQSTGTAVDITEVTLAETEMVSKKKDSNDAQAAELSMKKYRRKPVKLLATADGRAQVASLVRERQEQLKAWPSKGVRSK